jgi:hypothetical protein
MNFPFLDDLLLAKQRGARSRFFVAFSLYEITDSENAHPYSRFERQEFIEMLFVG